MDPSDDELTSQPSSDPAECDLQPVRISIVGVGGAGINAVGCLSGDLPPSVKTFAVDTDIAALNQASGGAAILLGSKLNRGLSCGGDVEAGRRSAEAESEIIHSAVAETDVVFIVTGLGRGTGGGATPVIAHAAAAAGALVIAFATLPLSIEGSSRSDVARKCLAELRLECDAVIPLPNDLLLQESDPNETVDRVFFRGNQSILKCVLAIHSMLAETGIINLDLATLRGALISRGGKTLFGVGSGAGDNRVAAALEDLFLCPLLHTPDHSRDADRLLLCVRGGVDLSLAHINRIAADVAERFCSSKDTLIGATILPSMKGKVEICVLGTTSIDGRAYVPRPKARRSTEHLQPAAKDAADVPVHASKLSRKHPKRPAQQEEFAFADGHHDRGFFQDAERSLVFGEDLDVPTFIRRGLRISF